ncbi:hypothetical protein, conserved [Plasmodium gonderi]|uniref:Uncharacterized protein n=1 Tax=Plasmodium gonderi TaxID=77519 RepID=A0A1Y1JEE5_PLAGO|nr:hypothetical protein, conserved [Plasmodium gonderi]GAW80866.1 hypothetical protein, conserved [Plasmodium gonderi]
MGNSASSKNEHVQKSLILLNDDLTYNLKKKNQGTNVEASGKKEEMENNVKEQYIAQVSLEEKERQYKKIRSEIVKDLIKEREKYMNKQKDTFHITNGDDSDDHFRDSQMNNNKCINDEHKIFKCLKNMNESTTGFVNSYSRCCRYLRKYENCVHKVGT